MTAAPSGASAHERIDALILDYQSGALDAEGLAELDTALRSDPEAAERFAHWCRHAVVLREVATMAAEARETAQRPSRQLPALRPSRRSAESRASPAKRITFPRMVMAAAAALIIGTFGAGFAIHAGSAHSIADGCVLARATSGVVFSDAQGNRPANAGDAIAPGQALVVPTGGSADVSYADGSHVELASGTRAVLLSLRDGQPIPCIELGTGGLTATISHQPAGRPLEVRTDLAKLTVIGTVFSLQQRSFGSCLSVREGQVRIERLSDGAAIDVPTGMAADAGPDVNLVARRTGDESGPAVSLLHEDFANGLPPNWGSGTLVSKDVAGFDRPAVRAVSHQVEPKNGVHGERLLIRSQPLDSSLVPYREDAWLHLTYRMKHRGKVAVEVFLGFFGPDNGDVAAMLYAKVQPADDGWQTLDLPLADMGQSTGTGNRAGSHMLWWVVDSYHSDCEMEVAEMAITTGP